MTLTVRYFAALRDQMGKAEEEVEYDASTPRQLIDWLTERDGRAALLGEPFVRIIVNQDIVAADHALNPGDDIAFCPPFSGG